MKSPEEVGVVAGLLTEPHAIDRRSPVRYEPRDPTTLSSCSSRDLRSGGCVSVRRPDTTQPRGQKVASVSELQLQHQFLHRFHFNRILLDRFVGADKDGRLAIFAALSWQATVASFDERRIESDHVHVIAEAE